jgi:hypothetical protein
MSIDAPASGATVGGFINVAGWAADLNTSPVSAATAISGLTVSVDGGPAQNAIPDYGGSRPDVCGLSTSAYPAVPGAPGCPNVGYNFPLNTASWTNGVHTITVTATDGDPTNNTNSKSVSVTFSNSTPVPTGSFNPPPNPSPCYGFVGGTCDSTISWTSANTSLVEVVASYSTGGSASWTSLPSVGSQLDSFIPVQGSATYNLYDYSSGSQGAHLAGPLAVDGDPDPINGACGSDANTGSAYTPAQAAVFSQSPDMCSAGTPSTYPLSGSGGWSWGCNGQYSGSNTSNNACNANTSQSGSCSLNQQDLSFAATKGDNGNQVQDITITNTSPVTVTITPQVANAPGWFSLDNNAPQSIQAGQSFSFGVHAITGGTQPGSYTFPDPSNPAQSFDFLISGGSEATCNTSYSASVSFTVVAPAKTLQSITVKPTNPTVTQGDNQSFTATGHYSDGTTADLTNVATWNSSNVVIAPYVGVVNGNPPAGTFNAAQAGSSNITACINATCNVPPAVMTVVAPPANSCSLSTASLAFSATAGDGQKQTQTITVTNTSGFTVNVSPQLTGPVASWFSISPLSQQGMVANNGTAVFTVSAITGAVQPGTYSYSFNFVLANPNGNGGASCNTSDPATVIFTVNPGSGSGSDFITVSPPNPNVPFGVSQGFTAVETINGNANIITNTATWSSTGADAADATHVGNSPTFTAGNAIGTPTIQACDTTTHVCGSTTMNVINSGGVSLVVLPSQTVWAGTSIKIIASGGTGSFDPWSISQGAIPEALTGQTESSSGGDTHNILSGSFPVSSNPFYTVEVFDSANNHASTNVTVVSPICALSASPQIIVPPESATVTWSCISTPASNLSPTCDLNDGTNDPTVVDTGNLTENISTTTTFTLTCVGTGSGAGNKWQGTEKITAAGVGIQEVAP